MSQKCHDRTHAPQQTPSYSITSSARASTVAGTSRPSVLAVLRLSIVSYLVGSCTGRSPERPFQRRAAESQDERAPSVPAISRPAGTLVRLMPPNGRGLFFLTL